MTTEFSKAQNEGRSTGRIVAQLASETNLELLSILLVLDVFARPWIGQDDSIPDELLPEEHRSLYHWQLTLLMFVRGVRVAVISNMRGS